MDSRRVRIRVGGWGAVVLGGAAAVVAVAEWGPSLLTVLFVVFALAGVAMLTGHERLYYRGLLPVMAVLSALLLILSYDQGTDTVYVVLLALLTGVFLFRSVQAYRVEF